jgi:hypothetical protein
MSFRISWKLHALCFAVGYLFCKGYENTISTLLEGFIINYEPFRITNIFFADYLIPFIFILMIVVIIHELCHAAILIAFRRKVKFGFKHLCPYTQDITGTVIHRTNFLLVLLTPITIISLTSLLLPTWIGGIIFLINLLGSTGDLIMSFYLCLTNSNSYILDTSYGFEVITVTDKIENYNIT